MNTTTEYFTREVNTLENAGEYDIILMDGSVVEDVIFQEEDAYVDGNPPLFYKHIGQDYLEMNYLLETTLGWRIRS